MGNDFFLSEFKDEFLDSARYLISEAYCRIHQKIDIANLSESLNLLQEEGEKWIVNLIWETEMGVDAKIDLENVRQLLFPSPSLHFISLSLLFLWSLCSPIPLPSLERHRDKQDPQPVYQNVIEKTRQLVVHTQALGVAMARSDQQGASSGNGLIPHASGHCQLID